MKYVDNADDDNGDDASKGWSKFAGISKLKHYTCVYRQVWALSSCTNAERYVFSGNWRIKTEFITKSWRCRPKGRRVGACKSGGRVVRCDWILV